MKRYKLLKSLPDCEAGAIYHLDYTGENYVCYDNISQSKWSVAYNKKYVENNSEWFELIPEPIPDNKKFHSPLSLGVFMMQTSDVLKESLEVLRKIYEHKRLKAKAKSSPPSTAAEKNYIPKDFKLKERKIDWDKILPPQSTTNEQPIERIEVEVNKMKLSDTPKCYTYSFQYELCHGAIPKEKLPAIKKAIEQVLNDDGWVYLAAAVDRQTDEYIKSQMHKKYSQKELDEAEESAWNFAREKAILDRNPAERQYRFLSLDQYRGYKKQMQSLSSNKK